MVWEIGTGKQKNLRNCSLLVCGFRSAVQKKTGQRVCKSQKKG